MPVDSVPGGARKSQILWGHPLTNGLVLHAFNSDLLNGGGPEQMMNTNPASTSIAVGYSPETAAGPGLTSADSGGGARTNFNGRYSPFWPTTGNATLYWDGVLTGATSTGGAFIGYPNFTNPTVTYALAVQRPSGDEIRIEVRSGGTNFQTTSSGASLSTQYHQPIQIVVSRTIGQGTYGYVNGRLVVQDTTNVSAPTGVTVNRLYIAGTFGILDIKVRTHRFAVWNRGLSPGEVAGLQAEPYGFLTQSAVPRRFFLLSGAAPEPGPSGSAAITQANQTSAATGSETITGSAAASQAAQTSTATGTTITGSAAASQAAQTSTATGSETITGSSSASQAAQTSTATGAHTTTIIGTSATSQANQTSTATGATITGSAAVTQANQTSTANGTHTGTGPVVEAIGGQWSPRFHPPLYEPPPPPLEITGTGNATQAANQCYGTGDHVYYIAGTASTWQVGDRAALTGYIDVDGAESELMLLMDLL